MIVDNTPEQRGSVKPAEQVRPQQEGGKMSKSMQVLIAVVLILMFVGTMYLYNIGLSSAEDLGVKDQQLKVLQEDNKGLKAKVERQRKAALAAEKLQQQHQKRVETARQVGCKELSEKLPACIGELRNSTINDYMEAIKTQ